MSLDERVAQLESDLSFLARFIRQSSLGHNMPSEHGRLRKLADREPRFEAQAPTSAERNWIDRQMPEVGGA